MPLHPFKPLQGEIVSFTMSSKHLKNNKLGDPHERQVSVYLPPSYKENKEERYPLFMYLAAYTGSGLKQLGWKAYEETLPMRLERLVEEGKMRDVICVFPDCFTSLGGNQYINSKAMGNWADYIHEEVLREVDKRFRTKATKESRAVLGKSSGGYGSLVFGMKYAEHWGAIACQSGDIDFELLYKADFPKCVTKLAKYEYDIKAFLRAFDEDKKVSGENFCTLMILAMAATYAPNDKKFKGIELPVDYETCQIKEELWKKWLYHDPLSLIESKEAQENLKSLKGLFIDCGFKDQYHLHYGARRFCKKLEEYKIKHHHEEFNGTHSGIDHRLDVSLPFLFQALS